MACFFTNKLRFMVTYCLLLAFSSNMVLAGTLKPLSASKKAAAEERIRQREEKKMRLARKSDPKVINEVQTILSATATEFEAAETGSSDYELAQVEMSRKVQQVSGDVSHRAILLAYLGELMAQALAGKEVIAQRIVQGDAQGQGEAHYRAGAAFANGDASVPLADLALRNARVNQLLAMAHELVSGVQKPSFGRSSYLERSQWIIDEGTGEMMSDSAVGLGMVSGLVSAVLVFMYGWHLTNRVSDCNDDVQRLNALFNELGQKWWWIGDQLTGNAPTGRPPGDFFTAANWYLMGHYPFMRIIIASIVLAASIPLMKEVMRYVGRNAAIAQRNLVIAVGNAQNARNEKRQFQESQANLWQIFAESLNNAIDTNGSSREAQSLRKLVRSIQKGMVEKASAIACDMELGGTQLVEIASAATQHGLTGVRVTGDATQEGRAPAPTPEQGLDINPPKVNVTEKK